MTKAEAFQYQRRKYINQSESKRRNSKANRERREQNWQMRAEKNAAEYTRKNK